MTTEKTAKIGTKFIESLVNKMNIIVKRGNIIKDSYLTYLGING